MANEVKWIKIVTDIFDDDAFQIIDDLPERDAIELIWFKLLIFAGKKNNHGIFLYKDTVPYTDEMLASVFHRPLNTVRLAMETFENLKMIETINNVYSIPNWDKYQTLDALEKKKEYDRERQRKCREEQQRLIEEKKSCDSRVTSYDLSCDSRVTSYDSSYSYSSSNSNSYSLFIKEIIDYLNTITNKKYTYTNKSFNRYIEARLKEGFSVEDFKTVIDKKYKEWNGTEFEKFLKPTTLFAPSHFEEYLNQEVKEQKTETEKFLDKWRNA